MEEPKATPANRCVLVIFGGGGFGLAGGEAGGDLQAVEEEAGELLVDGPGDDAVHDFYERELDAGAVLEGMEAESGLDGIAGGDDLCVGAGQGAGLDLVGGAVRGVVVEAELLAGEGEAAAAAAGDVDVTALEVLGLFGLGGFGLRHGSS